MYRCHTAYCIGKDEEAILCTLCKENPASHFEDGRSRRVDPPYPVCDRCAREMDEQESGISPLDRKHYVSKTKLI